MAGERERETKTIRETQREREREESRRDALEIRAENGRLQRKVQGFGP
jgi:hypothetical protein